MTGDEEAGEFEAELHRRFAELHSRPNGGYPEDYRDPPYDGTVTGFGDVVLPARIKAVGQTINEALADLLPEGYRFEWVSDDA